MSDSEDTKTAGGTRDGKHNALGLSNQALLTGVPAKSSSSKDAWRVKLREERKAKRHDKAAAKAARKTNIKPAAKWTEEKKAETKAKGADKKAAKWEKLRLSLPNKATKARAKAEDLIRSAEKYDLQYKQMTKEKEVRFHALACCDFNGSPGSTGSRGG